MFGRYKKMKYQLFLIVDGMKAMSEQFKSRMERTDNENEKESLKNAHSLLEYWLKEINEKCMKM
jgi:hypothetical protein